MISYDNCPYGFVIPNGNINDNRIKYYEDTNCAYGCIENFYTKDQWSRKETACFAFGIVGLILSFIFLIVETYDSEKRKQYLIVSLSIFTTISSIGIVINSQPGEINEKRFCETNAIKLSMTSGVSACTAQSVLVLFGSLGTSAAWLCQCFDLFFKVCLGRKTNSNSYLYSYMSFIIGLPVIMLIYQLSSSSAGYGGHIWCVYSVEARTNGFIYIAVAAPIVIICILGLILMTCVCYTIIKSTYSNTPSKSNVGKALKTLRVPIIFCMLYLVMAITCVYNVILTGTDGPVVYDSTLDFDKCIFENYDGIHDNSWMSVCGVHQKIRYKHNMWLNFCLSGQSIFISLIFLPFAFQKINSEKSSYRKNTGLRGSIRSNHTVAIDYDDSENSISIRRFNQENSYRSNDSSFRIITQENQSSIDNSSLENNNDDNGYNIDIKTVNEIQDNEIQDNSITNSITELSE